MEGDMGNLSSRLRQSHLRHGVHWPSARYMGVGPIKHLGNILLAGATVIALSGSAGAADLARPARFMLHRRLRWLPCLPGPDATSGATLGASGRITTGRIRSSAIL